MVALVVGLVFVVIGVLGIARWLPDFVVIIKGLVPIMLLFGGLLAIVAGITSIKDSVEAKKLEEERKKEGEQK